MKFTPKTEKEIAEENLWQPGEYSFEVLEAADKVSKAGNEMIELKLKVYADDGGYIFVNDYLMDTVAYKLRHAADACACLAKYETGMLQADDFKAKAGRLKLKIQKDKSGTYPDKNVVGDYVKSGKESSNGVAQVASASVPLPDDSIPF